MDWLNDLLQNWEFISTVVGFLIGLIGGIWAIAWRVIKRGRAVYKTFYENAGSWTPEKKDLYIEKSAAFFESLKNLRKAIFDKK